MVSCAEQILQSISEIDELTTRLGLLGGVAALGVGAHFARRGLEKHNMRQAGFVMHPTSVNHMIHPETGQVKRIPRWYDR